MYKPLSDWLDKHEGKKVGSSYANIQKERVSQGYKPAKHKAIKHKLDKIGGSTGGGFIAGKCVNCDRRTSKGKCLICDKR